MDSLPRTKSALLSRDGRQQLKTAGSHGAHVVQEAFHDTSISRLLKTVIRHQEVIMPTGEPCTDFELVEEAAHYMRFAAGVYGHRLLHTTFFSDEEHFRPTRRKHKPGVNLQKFLRHVGGGLEPADVLVCKWGSTLYEPCWLLVRDRARHAIVVVIRGTLSPSDLMVDLMAQGRRCDLLGETGYIHSGIFAAFESVQEPITTALYGALEAHPGYRVVLTGHSLGAALATLLTVTLATADPLLEPRAFAFAPPAIFSENLAPKVQQFDLHAFVLRADIVPRLSVQSFNELLHRSSSKPSRLTQPPVQMVPSGKLYFLWTATNDRADCRVNYAKPADFRRIVPAKYMFRDHLPGYYEVALESLLQALGPASPASPWGSFLSHPAAMQEKVVEVY